MLKLGKLSSALVLSCFLCLAVFGTGAFAQSASPTATHAMAHNVVWHGHKNANGWGRGRLVRVTRLVRVVRLIRVTKLIRTTKVVVVTHFIRVVRFIHVTQFRRVGCSRGC